MAVKTGDERKGRGKGGSRAFELRGSIGVWQKAVVMRLDNLRGKARGKPNIIGARSTCLEPFAPLFDPQLSA